MNYGIIGEMPYSLGVFDQWIGETVDRLKPATVLDIGPGNGKYGELMRARAKQIGFVSRLTAIEIDESYVARFNLRAIYDEVIVDDAIALLKTPRRRFDLVIIGDCIEHMRKSDGVDLLNFLIYRSGYICVIYPDRYIQDDWEGHAAEAHISTWSMRDFGDWEVLHHLNDGVHMFLITGFQPSPVRIVK